MRYLALFIYKHYRWVSIACLLLVSVLSMIPLPELPEFPNGDKLHHLMAYVALAVPVSLARPKHFAYVLLFYIAYSGLIEIIQPYVNRYADWADLCANAAGVLIGFGVGSMLRVKLKP